MRRFSPKQVVIVVGALAAALAGADVGARTRPASARAAATLGPRIDFDRAAHPAALTARGGAAQDG